MEKKFIVRSVQAGVFYGEIKERNGQEVTMANARCLWYWDGAASLMQLAKEGVTNPDSCQFTVVVDEVTILDVCEILPCTAEAIKCIDNVRVWKR